MRHNLKAHHRRQQVYEAIQVHGSDAYHIARTVQISAVHARTVLNQLTASGMLLRERDPESPNGVGYVFKRKAA